jgi:hypothetical protein
MVPHELDSETLSNIRNQEFPRRNLSVGFKRMNNKHLDEHPNRNIDIGRGLFRNLQSQDMIRFVSRTDFNKARQV